MSAERGDRQTEINTHRHIQALQLWRTGAFFLFANLVEKVLCDSIQKVSKDIFCDCAASLCVEAEKMSDVPMVHARRITNYPCRMAASISLLL